MLIALSVGLKETLPVGERGAGEQTTVRVPTIQPARSALATQDVDRDGLDDRREDALAEQFAPIVFRGDRETSFPLSVESWLEATHLLLVGPASRQRVAAGPLTQAQLLGHQVHAGATVVSSSGTRSRSKGISFALENVSVAMRSRALRPDDWVTYVHSYPNEAGGVTLQYWWAYAWNDVRVLGIDMSHGGDWEAVAVHLDAASRPYRTTFLDHTGIVDGRDQVQWEGTHPLVWSEEGSHSNHPDKRGSKSSRWLRHETWSGGTVTRWDTVALGAGGGLRNVGEKSSPRNGQIFIQYSGLWGSPGRLFMTSGYWGPAFNETDARCEDGSSAYRPYLRRRAESAICGRIFIRAWCDGMDPSVLNIDRECHAVDDGR
jgi:hypothetical protein